MANIPKLVNIGKVTKNFQESLERRTGITNFASDSVVRSIYLPVVSEIQRMENENRRSFQAFQIDGASGPDLDSIASNHGIIRLSPTFAETYPAESNFYFYCETSFGSLNGGQDILIPKGTKVHFGDTARNNEIVYEVVRDYNLPSGSQRAFCQIRALTAGRTQNVNKSSLIKHDFTNYSNYINGSLKCNNLYPILNGTNRESDESLRYRIVSNYASVVKDSEDSLFLRSLEVPGVTKIITIPSYYGIGTVGVFVFGASEKANRGLIKAVERKLEFVKAPGVRYFVLGGIAVYLDFDITVYLKNRTSTRIQEKIRTSIFRALSNFLTRTAANRVVDVSELRDIILSSDKEIAGVLSKSGSNNLFDALYIRRSFGEAKVTSERTTIRSPRITIGEEEFFTLGMVHIDFEVDR